MFCIYLPIFINRYLRKLYTEKRFCFPHMYVPIPTLGIQSNVKNMRMYKYTGIYNVGKVKGEINS